MGAAGGAVIGQAIGRNTEATLIGVAVGTLIGYIVGNEMDKYDRQELNHVYERGVSGQPSSWQNPDTGNTYTVTPQPAVQGQSGPCRKAEIRAVIDGKTETTYSTACRDEYGQWILE
jgi:surface antigen